MKLLEKCDYFKVIEPLRKVGINHLFVRAIIAGHINGDIYVDDKHNPTSFYVIHPYGMSLLFGDNNNAIFNAWLFAHALNLFQKRDKFEWLQAYPNEWNDQITTQWGDYLVKSDAASISDTSKIEVNTRVNFKFNKERYNLFKNSFSHFEWKVVRTNGDMFEKMSGAVIPKHFWMNASDFDKKAVAFSVVEDGEVVSTAFSAFVLDGELEIGIETVSSFQGKGYAIVACSALIDYCLKEGFEPVWSCRFENTSSYNLAQKLGFEPTIYWPFYRLID